MQQGAGSAGNTGGVATAVPFEAPPGKRLGAAEEGQGKNGHTEATLPTVKDSVDGTEVDGMGCRTTGGHNSRARSRAHGVLRGKASSAVTAWPRPGRQSAAEATASHEGRGWNG
jgi:hypothetical protein